MSKAYNLISGTAPEVSTMTNGPATRSFTTPEGRVLFGDHITKILEMTGRKGPISGAELDALIDEHSDLFDRFPSGKGPVGALGGGAPSATLFEGVSDYRKLDAMQMHRLRTESPELEGRMRAAAGLDAVPPPAALGAAGINGKNEFNQRIPDEDSIAANAAEWNAMSEAEREQLRARNIAQYISLKNDALRVAHLSGK